MRKTARRRGGRNSREAPAATNIHAASASPPDLSESEQDLLSHLQNGHTLETDTLGGDLLLREPKGGEAIRPLSATRNTVKALEERGLITRERGNDPLRILWRLNDDKPAKKPRTKHAAGPRRAARRRH